MDKMDNQLWIKLRSIGIFILAISYLTSVFVQSVWLNEFIDVVLIMVVVLSAAAARGTSRLIGYALFALGGVLLWLYDAPLGVWEQALNRNLFLLVMFTLVPLLGIPIRRGGYMIVLQGFFKRFVRRDHQFYLLVKIITFLVAILINVAVIPLMYQLSLASEKSKNGRLLSTAIIRGFAASIIWAPSYAAVALIIELTGANWLEFFPYGLFMGTAALLIGWLLTVWQEKSIDSDKTSAGDVKVDDIIISWQKIIELTAFGVVMLGSIVVLSIITDIKTVIIVALISLVYPLIWLALIGRIRVFPEEFRGQYFAVNLPKLKNEVVLFLGAGFFSTAVNYSQLGSMVPRLLNGVVGSNTVLLSIAVVSVTVIFSMAGIHPIITVTIFGSTLQPEVYHISHNLLALMLTVSWSLGVTVSPSSGINVAMSGQIDRSPMEIGPRWNAGYTFIIMVILLLMLNLFNSFSLL
ncbi:hypothetical protein MFMK1_001989 [Metallumcola ferriviriculae]|uniref:Uncharacterized protein n=1 Tax=Metallumcola ferriviriculae TaxID=3039180 RepID=A0AAU0UN01_9FIRM|nr:hypothetical protein MFMK1_001989 [Desulfitibacteraceae bacterium MK1]